VNRDKTGEADGMNLEVASIDEVMHTYMSYLLTLSLNMNKCKTNCSLCTS